VGNWNVNASGVLHVGAHLAEESVNYELMNWDPVIWIEAQPKLVRLLKENLNLAQDKIIEAAIYSESGKKMTLNITNNSQSSSLLNFGTHAKSYPEVLVTHGIEVETKRLDELLTRDEMPNFINIDIQGVELEALKSLGSLVDKIDYMYIEVNMRRVYEGCSNVREIDRYLKARGFNRMTTRWFVRAGWGDAVYIRGKNHSRSIQQRWNNTKGVIYFYSPQVLNVLRKMFS
jgi:FkbM family methyltransferase